MKDLASQYSERQQVAPEKHDREWQGFGHAETSGDAKPSSQAMPGGKGPTHDKSEEAAHRQERDTASY